MCAFTKGNPAVRIWPGSTVALAFLCRKVDFAVLWLNNVSDCPAADVSSEGAWSCWRQRVTVWRPDPDTTAQTHSHLSSVCVYLCVCVVPTDTRVTVVKTKYGTVLLHFASVRMSSNWLNLQNWLLEPLSHQHERERQREGAEDSQLNVISRSIQCLSAALIFYSDAELNM